MRYQTPNLADREGRLIPTVPSFSPDTLPCSVQHSRAASCYVPAQRIRHTYPLFLVQELRSFHIWAANASYSEISDAFTRVSYSYGVFNEPCGEGRLSHVLGVTRRRRNAMQDTQDVATV